MSLGHVGHVIDVVDDFARRRALRLLEILNSRHDQADDLHGPCPAARRALLSLAPRGVPLASPRLAHAFLGHFIPRRLTENFALRARCSAQQKTAKNQRTRATDQKKKKKDPGSPTPIILRSSLAGAAAVANLEGGREKIIASSRRTSDFSSLRDDGRYARAEQFILFAQCGYLSLSLSFECKREPLSRGSFVFAV